MVLIPGKPRARVAAGEIADMAGVSPSAVSNWRRRNSDFPVPVESGAVGDLFDQAEIVTWLERHDKQARPSIVTSEEWASAALQSVAQDLSAPEATELLLQVLVWRAAAEGALRDAFAPLAAVWTTAVAAEPDLAEAVRASLAAAFPEREPSARALALPTRANSKAIASMIQFINPLPANVSWPDLAQAIMAAYTELVGRSDEGFTSGPLAELMVGLLKPVIGAVYDPAAGAATALVELSRVAGGKGVHIWGQEINEHHWRLGFLRLAMEGVDFQFLSGDTLRDDGARGLLADRIVLDPPPGMKTPKGLVASDPRWSLGAPGRYADWLWVQHLTHHLAEGGRGVATLTSGPLLRTGTDERVRRELVGQGLLDAVIALPAGMLAGSAIPSFVLLFDKGRSGREDRVLFVDASGLGVTRRGRSAAFEEGALERILETVEAWRSGVFESEDRFSGSATLDEICQGDASLLPSRFVRYLSPEALGLQEPLSDRIESTRQEVHESIRDVDVLTDFLDETLEGLQHVNEASSSERTRLHNLLVQDPIRGSPQKKDGSGEPTPFVEPGDLEEGFGTLSRTPTAGTYGADPEQLARQGDILLTVRGDGSAQVARVALEEPVAYSHHVVRLRPNPDVVLSEYLALVLGSEQAKGALKALSSGRGHGGVRISALKELELIVPPIEMQDRLTSVGGKLVVLASGFLSGANACVSLLKLVREGITAGLIRADEVVEE